MLKNFKTGWTKHNIGGYETPNWGIQLIDQSNHALGFELQVKGESDGKYECVLKGFLSEDYTFLIPVDKAKDSDGRLNNGKILEWVLEQIKKLLCPQCD